MELLLHGLGAQQFQTRAVLVDQEQSATRKRNPIVMPFGPLGLPGPNPTWEAVPAGTAPGLAPDPVTPNGQTSLRSLSPAAQTH